MAVPHGLPKCTEMSVSTTRGEKSECCRAFGASRAYFVVSAKGHSICLVHRLLGVPNAMKPPKIILDYTEIH